MNTKNLISQLLLIMIVWVSGIMYLSVDTQAQTKKRRYGTRINNHDKKDEPRTFNTPEGAFVLNIKNETPLTVDIFRKNSKGLPILMKSLPHGEIYKHTAIEKEKWVINDQYSKSPLLQFAANSKYANFAVKLNHIKSMGSSQKVSLNLVNKNPFDVVVFWKDQQGKEQRRGTLKGGQSIVQKTYLSHPWVMRNAKTGELVGLIIANEQQQQTYAFGKGYQKPTTSTEPEELKKPYTPIKPTRRPSKPTDSTKPTQPEKPTKPTAPVKPTKPEKPTKPTAPVKPTKPEKPTKPTAPVKPTKPEKPTKPTAPVKPTQPEKPTKPTAPVKPTKPEKPTKPTAPVKPTKPEKPTKPIAPVKPTKPEKPTKPTAPVKPTKPEKPTKPTAPVKPTKPEKPTKPTAPVKPTKPEKPTKPTAPVKPTQPEKPTTNTNSNPSTPKSMEEKMEDQILSLINNHRVKKGLNPLQLHPIIRQYSRDHSVYMKQKGKISHDNFTPRMNQLTQALGGASRRGENVARQYSAQEAFNAWMGSKGHRENIERPDFTHTGLGIVAKGDGSYYMTNIFIKK